MSGRITTHVLDTATGRPAAGLELVLVRLPGREVVARCRTNRDGRCDAPLLSGAALIASEYEITWDVAGWRGAPGFYNTISVRFRVVDPGESHHVPLILAPFGYSTYRGS